MIQGGGVQPKITADNDGSLRGRGLTYLDKNEGKSHVFAEKYQKKIKIIYIL